MMEYHRQIRIEWPSDQCVTWKGGQPTVHKGTVVLYVLHHIGVCLYARMLKFKYKMHIWIQGWTVLYCIVESCFTVLYLLMNGRKKGK